MNIILVGPPGGGKGTQATIIKDKLKIAHISTGDMLREHIKNESDLGKEANEYIKRGDLVPDSLIISMIEERLKDKDCENGVLLDGFPRTLAQAIALDELFSKATKTLNAVINLIVDDEALVKRLLSRGRADDNEETIRNRLVVFKSQTSPIIEHYKKAGKVFDINGSGDIEAISGDIFKVLGQ